MRSDGKKAIVLDIKKEVEKTSSKLSKKFVRLLLKFKPMTFHQP